MRAAPERVAGYGPGASTTPSCDSAVRPVTRFTTQSLVLESTKSSRVHVANSAACCTGGVPGLGVVTVSCPSGLVGEFERTYTVSEPTSTHVEGMDMNV